MRRALVVVAMLGRGTSAWSEPAADPPKAYVAFGAVAGIGVDFYDAVSLEVGYRPGRYGLWLHAVIQVGDIRHLFPSQEGSEEEITDSGHKTFRLGIDKRACLGGDVWCVIAGVDVGYLHQYAISQSNPQDVRGPAVAPHLGLDLGGSLRFRPGIEASFAPGGETIALTAAIAIMF